MSRKFESIAPTEFQSPDQLPPEQGWQFRASHLIIFFAVLMAAAILYFLLSARAVVFKANPESARISIQGGISIPIGESNLLLRGDYDVSVEAEGYAAINAQLRVDSDTPPEVFYEMVPLPGDLKIVIAGDEQISGSATLSGELIDAPITIEAPNELLFKGLPAGVYQLSVDANLYSEKTIDVEIPGRNLIHEVSIQLEPNWGWVVLETAPPQAELAVDGINLAPEQHADDSDTNAIRARVEVGGTELQISLENYKPVSRELNIAQNEEFDLGYIALEHVDSRVSVTTEPEGVSLVLNKNYLGETPMILDLLPDQVHNIELFKAGYKSLTESIQVERNSEIDLNYEMQPDLVQVSLSLFPSNAKLKISGKTLSNSAGQISLPAIKHPIEVSAPGYETQTLDFLPVRGTRQHLQVRLLTEEQALWAKIPASYTNLIGQELKLFRDAGEVQMGSSRRETGRRANETNWSARLERPFYVGLTEITNRQYKVFDPEHSSGHFQGQSLDGANQPVINISWQQAALYCNWLSEQEGLEPFYTVERGFVSGQNAGSVGYRLLTEAEWTWLAKINPVGFSQKYIWGDSEEITSAVENYADQSVAEAINFTLDSVNDGFATSAPVASFPPNSKGIYDLSGNVNEWIHDWYDTQPYKTGETMVDPLGPDEGEFHVIRGASWARGYLPQLRLAYRDYDSTGRNDLGFRIARFAM